MTLKSSCPQYLAAVTGSLSVFCAGLCYAWVGPLLVGMLSGEGAVAATPDQSSWLIALLELGNVFTPVPSGLLVNSLGRKTLLLVTAPLFTLCWALVLLTRSVHVLYFVRFAQGMGIGLVFTGLPLYLAEIAEPRTRGTVTTLVSFMWNLGFLYQFCLGPFLSYQRFIWLSLVPCLIFAATFVWMPESPNFLMARGQSARAGEALAWLRGKETVEEVAEELSALKSSLNREAAEKAGFRDLLGSLAGRKAMAVVQLTVALKVLTGGTAMQSYVTQALSQVGAVGAAGPQVGSILMCALTLLVTLVSALLMDGWGRRPLLCLPSLAAALCSLVASVYYFLRSETGVDVDGLGWLPYTALVLSSSLVAMGAGTVGVVFRAELFPTATRGLAAGLTSTSLTFLSFLTLKLHQVIADSVGLYFDFLVYALVGFVGSFLAFRYVPETKGKTLEEIQQMLK